MTTLNDETIIVTGASKGLGRSMVLALSERGANVVLTARSEDELETVADEAAGETLVVPADVRAADDVDRVVEAALERFGRVDTLINNAGVSGLSFGEERRSLVETDEEEWDTIMDVNVKGVYLFTKRVLEAMLEAGQDSGNVVNVSSGLGRYAIPDAAAYITSKWGLEGFTQAVALEVEDEGINVNAIDPGGRVNTRIWEHLPDDERGEILQPDVMDDAAALLAAQGPDGVTGESMTAEEWEDRLA
ncbi:SDR family oxidoreductase [Natrinema thermotolerans]|uniref:SDR family oxidoreductase n=1 Tax=Natrinema thermotolerans TaxID=121872 RepID=A0AAF0P9S1_9EURY|nr:SDR family oxidoreductase [Natrinema thermotolerans]QCC60570.1 SDR family oxidoreductase [Natrinema thermotolerans]QCC61458.1 SDR family oxidoreductase [Natrinema thermotolerans]WMT07612.1 SDR family oxidoreductase [Natrinema thermotolerans]WMT08244.1 SDR family oxidoreductase [Natrinema thermotolerans]